MTNPLSDPPALLAWQQVFDLFGSRFHRLLSIFEKAVHEHVNAHVNVDENRDR